MMERLAIGCLTREHADEMLVILERVRPVDAMLILDESSFNNPGPLEALHAYICWPGFEDYGMHDSRWRALQIARRKHALPLYPWTPNNPGLGGLSLEGIDPASDAHQPGLCLSVWKPALHRLAGRAARRATAALLAARRPSAAAALRLGRAVVDAHRLFALPESQ
jgi:hypothetical protein